MKKGGSHCNKGHTSTFIPRLRIGIARPAAANNLNLFPCIMPSVNRTQLPCCTVLRSVHLDSLISAPCFTSQIITPTIICSGSYQIAIKVESRRQVSKSVSRFMQEITEDLASIAALPCMDLSLFKNRLARCLPLRRRTRLLKLFTNHEQLTISDGQNRHDMQMPNEYKEQKHPT